jgi:hypothetical protein
VSVSHLDTVLTAINLAVETLALIFGGAFAYYKFAKGRTFRRRANVQLDSRTVEIEHTYWVEAVVRFTNTGLSRIDLDPILTELVFQYMPAGRLRSSVGDGWLATRGHQLLPDEGVVGVEPGETEVFEYVTPTPEEAVPWEPVAYRLLATIAARPRRHRRPEATVWKTYQLLSPPESSTTVDASGV